MQGKVRRTAMTAAAIGGMALGGAGVASAVSGSGSAAKSRSTTPPSGARAARPQHTPETALTGTAADKVRAAALAKVSGGTILRVETDSDTGSPYEAHVQKSDGTQVVVYVNKDFTVTSVAPFGGPGGRFGGPPPAGMPRPGAATSGTPPAAPAALSAGRRDSSSFEDGGSRRSALRSHLHPRAGLTASSPTPSPACGPAAPLARELDAVVTALESYAAPGSS